jgi:hypothetical protein
MKCTYKHWHSALVTAAMSVVAAGCAHNSPHLVAPGDSPVRVVGGSINLLDDKGWTQTSVPSSGSCLTNVVINGVDVQVDVCNYTSEMIPMKTITIENVTDAGGAIYTADNPVSITVASPWKINVYASKDDGTVDTNGISVCSSTSANPSSGSAGACDALTTSTASPYVTIAPIASYGFYAPDPNTKAKDKIDKRYHNPNANLTNCPFEHCEDMNQIAVTMGTGSPTVYTCITSAECKIKIGK